MAKQKGKGFPLAMAMAREMPLVMAMAMETPLAMAMAMAMETPLAMAREMPLFCGLFLNCRYLYYTWILKFYMETFWIAPNLDSGYITFIPYPCYYILLQTIPLQIPLHMLIAYVYVIVGSGVTLFVTQKVSQCDTFCHYVIHYPTVKIKKPYKSNTYRVGILYANVFA